MKTRPIPVALMLGLLASSPSFAQAPSQAPIQPAAGQKANVSACESFAQAIEQSLKAIDMAYGDDITDNSAPRATLSNIKVNSQLLLISMNLQLAHDSGCPTRKEPIRTGRYLDAAITCKTDLLAASVKRDKETPASCNTSTWRANDP